MKKALRAFAHSYLPVLAYLVLMFLLFRNLAVMEGLDGQLSLRYTDTPLTAKQVAIARSYALDEDNEAPFETAFWYQLQDTGISNDFGTSSTAAVFVDGDIASVYPVEFLTGGYPTSIDDGGIAVSEMLGWQLFGGGDIVGSELEWNGRTWYVRGVFEGLDPLLLAQVDANKLEEGTFTGVEMVGDVQFGDPRDVAAEYAQKMGLGKPTAVVEGSTLATLMRLMAFLPLAILVVWFLLKVIRQLRRVGFWPRQLILLAVLLGLAYCVPWLMNQLPGWMIPNKWSDLDAWSDFFTTMRSRVNELLGLYPSMQDVETKKLLFTQLVLTVPCLFAITTAIRVWSARLTAFLRGGEAAVTAIAVETPVEEEDPLELLPGLQERFDGEDDRLR